jgi:branched-subunit amino acid aminotransferase/4-amino-4-deoxychorismate lyase
MMELDGAPAQVHQVAALGLYNFGHFTTMRVDAGRVRGLSLHMDRLRHDCRQLFDDDLDTDRVRSFIRHAIDRVPEPVVARVTVFDPTVELGHPGRRAEPHILVTTRPALPDELPPLRVQSVAYRRELPEVKHVGLFGTLRHRRAAQLNGFDDALFTDADSNISEGAAWNIGFIVDDRITWPRADYLPGVTMRLIDAQHPGQTTSMPVNITRLDAIQAVFCTNAATGVRVVAAINDANWSSDQPVIETMRARYKGIPLEHL